MPNSRQLLDSMLTNWYKKHPKARLEKYENECEHRDALMAIIGGSKEVLTPFGRIDILTNDFVIECKRYSTHGAKAAIGQALCYTYYHPGLTPVVALIGRPNKTVMTVCNNYGIIDLWYHNNIWMTTI